MKSASSSVLSCFVILLAGMTMRSGVAFASDEIARQKLEEGKVLYSQRESLDRNQLAIQVLAEAEAQAQDQELKYEILVLESRALYWAGMHAQSEQAKKDLFKAGKAKSDVAKRVNDDYADAYYYAGINLGRLAEVIGIPANLPMKRELVTNMEEAMARETQRDKTDGEAIDGYGPRRVFGKMFAKLPPFAGGSREKALKNLEIAFSKAKNHALNVVYYAEVLSQGSDSEKAKANQILDELLSKDPRTYNLSRVPETVEEFVEARRLRAELGR